MLLYQTLAFTIHGKSIKKSYKSLGSTKSKITKDENKTCASFRNY